MKVKTYKALFISLLVLFITGSFERAEAQLYPVKFIKDTLQNGLTVIYHQDNSTPIVSTVLQYRVGSKDEISTQTGYAHFFEHLMFEATENIPRASIDKYVQEAGGNLNAFTSFDKTVFHFQLPSNQIKLALWIESERMRGLKVQSEGVETQRGVVLEEIKQTTTNQPYGTLLQKTMENLFTGTSYGWDVLGFEKNIASATIGNFQNFYNNFYQPNNAILVIAGDFDLNGTKKMVNEYFANIPRGLSPKRNNIIFSPMQKSYRETINDAKVKLPGIFISFRGPAIGDTDYYATSLLTDILAGGESSRLYQRLVDKEEMAVETAVEPIIMQDAGIILLYAIASPGKSIDKIEKLIYEEIDKIIKTGISDEELKKVKNITETNFVNDKNNSLSIAQSLAEYQGYFNNPNLINTEIDKYLKVTKEDIQKAAQLFLGTNKNVTLIYMPKD
ncbi:MAG: pitrilysin family protein [bacterium]